VSNTDSSLPPGGPTITRALKVLVATLDARSIRYAIIGGIAAIQYARVRATDDKELMAAYRGHLDLNFIRKEFSTVAEPNDARWAKFEEWST
jgi:hypothetical protein